MSAPCPLQQVRVKADEDATWLWVDNRKHALLRGSTESLLHCCLLNCAVWNTECVTWWGRVISV